MNIKTYNAISHTGLDYLKDRGYEINGDQDSDGILLRSQDLHKEPIPKSVKAVVRAGAGFNNILVSDLSKRGIPVFNTPGGNANAVKELTVAALIMAARPIVGAINFSNQVRGGDVSLRTEANKGGYRGTELYEKTLGVIGLGNVGSKVANIALAFGMKVIGYDPDLNANTAWRVDRHITHAKSVDEVLQQSDFVTVHIPYTKENHHFIDADKLAEMKPNAALINFSRGGIVDGEALDKAINRVLHKDEVADIILTAIFLDEQAVLMPESEPLKARLKRDANGHNVDEILAIGITQQFSAAATVHYGLLDDEKPGLIGEINDRTDTVNVYLDDILAALIASSAMTYLEVLGGNDY
ncbi:Phosphoglycerate dehydrogenase or related dehydrogenase (SerA) [Fructobacillus cardui]|nr:Phosphoglycerate dehydrogenase or related dehydrogenase (SerA) [Fructobacillus cardui]